MNRVRKPLQILVYQDVLCAWCFIADVRLESLRRELGELASWRTKPFPLQIRDSLPSPKDLAKWREETGRARLEREGSRLTDEIWRAEDPPRSSVSALAALEAARLQGDDARDALARAFQCAGLEQGLNVTRSDVVFEIAARLGLKMGPFAKAYQSREMRSFILQEHRAAVSRGVQGVPTLVINNRWMVSGLKELAEYRELLLRCVEPVGPAHPHSYERVVH